MSTSPTTPDRTSAPASSGALRPVLWLLLVVSAVTNAVASLTGAPLELFVVAQTTTGVSGLALVALALRGRRAQRRAPAGGVPSAA